MREAGKPVSAGDVPKALGADRKEIDKVFAELKKEGAIISPVPQMRKALEAKGITVSDHSFTCKGSMGPIHMGHPNQDDLNNFRKFIQSTI